LVEDSTIRAAGLGLHTIGGGFRIATFILLWALEFEISASPHLLRFKPANMGIPLRFEALSACTYQVNNITACTEAMSPKCLCFV
jgi:hypothetical protein